MERALVVHGHFYQPPRENPWTGEVDREPSAEPYHDWNERIFYECYRANAYSRIIDDLGRVERIVNNYIHVSFNFGPTLLQWLERHHAITYGRILEADRLSAALRNGHGNAIAQAYNHTILPLSPRRDKETQVRWGIIDFVHRFGRKPEGMWLPECAADVETLDVLIEHDIGFTILSPYQAKKVRKIGQRERSEELPWHDVSGGRVDTSIPYRVFHSDRSGRSIAIVFYDGPASRGIAFEGLLTSSQAFVDRLIKPPGGQGRLVSVATDGESYGHHGRWGDRCLAHAAEVVAKRSGLSLTNFAAHLAECSIGHEVQIDLGPDGRGSAWSCAHGVGRWVRDCGCHTGGRDGWTQAWRGPLRAALDYLRDRAAELFDGEASSFFTDPRAVQNEYAGALLVRESGTGDLDSGTRAFIRRKEKRPLSDAERVRALTLLEMQRHAQLMFTSCGWFFSDLSGIETRQILRYAGRVLDFVAEIAKDATGPFLERLSEARSNRTEEGSGADVFRRHVEPSRISPSRIAAHLAITSLLDDREETGEVAGYLYERTDFVRRSLGRISMCTGKVSIESTWTERRHAAGVAALHLGGIDFYAVVDDAPDPDEFARSVKRLWDAFAVASLPALLRLAAHELGPDEFGLEHLLPDSRERISEQIFASLLRRFSEEYARLYEDNRRTLDMLQSAGFPVPKELRAAAEFTLGRVFEGEIKKQEQSRNPEAYLRAIEIASEVEHHGYQIDRTTSRSLFEKMITDAVRTAVNRPNDEDAFDSALGLLALTERLRLNVDVDPAQEAAYDAALQKTRAPHEKFARLLTALRLSPEIGK